MPGLTWNERQRKIAESIIRHRREDDTYDSKLVMAEVPGASGGRISDVYKALKQAGWKIPPQEEPKGSPSQSVPVPLVAVKGSPITFDLGTEVVPFDRGDLYDSYALYKDLTVRGIIEHDSFSKVVRDGVALVWRVLVNKPVVKDGVVKSEVGNGRSTGQGDEGTGPR